MKIPLSWLRTYVPIEMDPMELAHRLTLAGLETTGVEIIGEGWDNIIVGHVVSVGPHPNADRLRLVTVNLGDEQLTVVCGAPNVAPDQRIAFARVGSTPINTHTGQREPLQAARIRGVVSQGMVCSARELGLGDDHQGILVLDPRAPVGMPLKEVLGDAILETEPTTNRPDWLSILGVAHEVSAITLQMTAEPPLSYWEEGPAIESLVKVFVDAPDLAPRYTGAIIQGVTVGPSPDWLQGSVTRAGLRPINNIVDITNFVMLEYGQPLHAFDYDTLGEHTVRVRRAAPGESLVTLDGQSRRLAPEMLVIADAQQPVGLAGVMGGANSEVTAATTGIFLESASFNPINIRRTAQALRHRTDASTRFERGLNPDLALNGLRRAVQLILSVCGGKAARGIYDLYSGRRPKTPILLTLARVRRVLGVDYDLGECFRVLHSLGFDADLRGDTGLLVHVPYWRSDIAIEDDLVEEIARIKGYDAVPMSFLSRGIMPHQPNPRRELREKVQDLLVGVGMQETISYAATSLEALQSVQDSAQVNQAMKLQNPLSTRPENFHAAKVEDTFRYREHMRTTLRAGILETLASNQRFIPAETGLRLFEMGRAYRKDPETDDLPRECEMAVGVLWGNRSPLNWSRQEGLLGFYDAKGVVEAVLAALRVSPEFAPTEDMLLRSGRASSVTVGGQAIGVVGEVRPIILDSFGASIGNVAFFELDLDTLLPLLPGVARTFAPLAEVPGAYRDLALVVDAGIPAAVVETIIRRHPLVEGVALFDVYTGDTVPAGKRSLAYRVHYQSPKQTLTAQAVNAAQEEILRDLERETGAALRG
ncbi:MAG: phenylalanine--tRNA ligase subunit beta [Chloroflexi bacterium]|nr:phenylalanine--tRNA ligase subunit beta [Chloroflexota bacterium]